MNDECTKKAWVFTWFPSESDRHEKEKEEEWGEKRREEEKDGRRKEGKEEESIENLNIIIKSDRVFIHYNSCLNKLEV